MSEPSGQKQRSVARPLVLSVIGAALVCPIPILAGAPERTPAWLLERVGTVPLLSIAMPVLMAGLVIVALLSLTTIDNRDA